MACSCEFMVENDMTFIRYTGSLNKDFIFDSITDQQVNSQIKNTNYFFIDMRGVNLELKLGDIAQIGAQLKNCLESRDHLLFIVDKPMETALIYLLQQYLSEDIVNIYTMPSSAFKKYALSSKKELTELKLYTKLCR